MDDVMFGRNGASKGDTHRAYASEAKSDILDCLFNARIFLNQARTEEDAIPFFCVPKQNFSEIVTRNLRTGSPWYRKSSNRFSEWSQKLDFCDLVIINYCTQIISGEIALRDRPPTVLSS